MHLPPSGRQGPRRVRPAAGRDGHGRAPTSLRREHSTSAAARGARAGIGMYGSVHGAAQEQVRAERRSLDERLATRADEHDGWRRRLAYEIAEGHAEGAGECPQRLHGGLACEPSSLETVALETPARIASSEALTPRAARNWIRLAATALTCHSVSFVIKRCFLVQHASRRGCAASHRAQRGSEGPDRRGFQLAADLRTHRSQVRRWLHEGGGARGGGVIHR